MNNEIAQSVKAIKQLFTVGNHGTIVNSAEIVAEIALVDKYHPSARYIHGSLRTIRNALISKHEMFSHTVSQDLVYDERYNRVDLTNPYKYIPVGRREVYGLRYVTDIGDVIYQASRDNEAGYSGGRLVTGCNRTIEARDAKLLIPEACKTILRQALLPIARTYGNGEVTELVAEVLNIRIKIEHL